ncbi:MAG: cache domain-containing protein [Magnetococcus sp. DMHC-1]
MMVFFLAGVLAWPQAGHARPQMSLEAAREQAEAQIEQMLFRIKMFHHEVKSTLLTTVEMPVFKEYFSLPESGSNTLNAMGVPTFSPSQVKLRKKMEEWATILNKRFPIGEVCLIDRTGQEHLRTVHGKVEDAHFFSNSESDSPFFAPSFRLLPGNIHTSDPYMSPDSLHWVIAYTIPIILENGDKPAFFHFEIPLDVYEKVLSSKDFSYSTGSGKFQLDSEEEGQYFLLDKDGLLLADSRQKIRSGLRTRDAADHHDDEDAADFTMREKLADYLLGVASISNDPRFLEATVRMRQGESGEAQLNLKGRTYILLYRPVPGRSWSLGHLDPVGQDGNLDRDKR